MADSDEEALAAFLVLRHAIKKDAAAVDQYGFDLGYWRGLRCAFRLTYI